MRSILKMRLTHVYALALMSADHSRKAIAIFMRTLLHQLDSVDIQRFRRALTWYVDELENQDLAYPSP